MLATLKGIGNDVKGVTSVGEALERHGMDWTVEKRPTFFKKNDGTDAQMGTSFATVRSDNETMLGRVGGDYVPMSNVDALKHVDALIASGIATLDSVFELKGGKRVGASLSLKESISIAGEDLINMYIVVMTSHDGTKADVTAITPIRMFCTNQMALITREARQSWSVRHLSTMADNLKLVEDELKMITNYSAWLKRTGEELINKTLSEIELQGVLQDALSFVNEKDRKTKMINEITGVFSTSPLIGEQFRGTAWAGLNAATEYMDHHRNYRTATARYNAITYGVGARVRDNVTKALISL